jgi:hypothetical protein
MRKQGLLIDVCSVTEYVYGWIIVGINYIREAFEPENVNCVSNQGFDSVKFQYHI